MIQEHIKDILLSNGKTEEEVVEILKAYDIPSMIEAEKGTFEVEVWDKKVPINGVPAEKLLQRNDVQLADEIYLIKDADNGRVVYFQPHNPFEQGFEPMTKENVLEVAERHVTQISEEKVANTILSIALS